MEKRYQIFVSSTFEDLKDERQAALRAILELDHMPAGMELFPAVDDDAWQLIRDVIDASDYYVLIMGGRYGSLDQIGISYTEKEYDYALKTGKPVIALLHKNPNNLPRGRTETDAKAWKRLSSFREKVEKKHACVYWTSAEELKSRLIISLTATTKRHPAIGWIRADRVPSSDAIQEIFALRNRVAELESTLSSTKAGPPPGTQDLAQGDDIVQINVWFTTRLRGERYPYDSDEDFRSVIEPTWDEVFAAVAPLMIDEASDMKLRKRIEAFVGQAVSEEFSDRDRFVRDVKNDQNQVETCIIQLRALGLIQESPRKRSVKDTGTYWSLTPYGDQRLVKLRALRKGEISRDPANEESTADETSNDSDLTPQVAE